MANENLEWPTVLPNDNGIRPAGKPDECFYCRQKVGESHSLECVTISKLIKVRYTITIEKEVPYSWTKDNVEFHINESSSCSDNEIDHILKFQKTLEERGDCFCPFIDAEYIEDVNTIPRIELRKDSHE